MPTYPPAGGEGGLSLIIFQVRKINDFFFLTELFVL